MAPLESLLKPLALPPRWPRFFTLLEARWEERTSLAGLARRYWVSML